MQAGQSRNSRFVSIPGLAGLLFFAVLAIYFQVELAAAFLLFFFLLCFVSRFWSRGVLKRVEFAAAPGADRCHAGETLTLDLRVRNKSFFPLVWLDVIVPTGKRPLVRTEGEEKDFWYVGTGEYEEQTGLRERFVWLLWQQEICWKETLQALRRGWIEIRGAELQAGDGFGLSARQRWQPFAVPLRLVIYPKIVPVAVQPFLKVTQEAVAKNRGQMEDVTILKGSRPYRPGDPVKRINWRLLAGSGRMENKLYETVMPGCAAFIIDPASFVKMVKEDGGTGEKEIPVPDTKKLEAMISLAASCMQAIVENGMSPALIIPAYGEREEVLLVPGDGEVSLEACMEALAMIDYQGQETRFSCEELWHAGHRIGSFYLCTRTEDRSVPKELENIPGSERMRRIVLEKGNAGRGEYDCLYAGELALEPLTERTV